MTTLPVITSSVSVSPVSGSDLCLRCGLCCQGVLHAGAALRPEDDAVAAELRLPVYDEPGGRGFTLPCPCHRDGKCSVYAVRPSPCRDYECELLGRVLRREVSLDQALEVVEAAKRMVRSLRAVMESRGIGPSENLWTRLEQLGDARRADAPNGTDDQDVALLLAAGILLAQVRRHFEFVRKPDQETSGPLAMGPKRGRQIPGPTQPRNFVL